METNHLRNCLLGVLKGRIHQAHLLCGKKEDLVAELELLTDVFVAYGYPYHIVSQTIKESCKAEFFKSLSENNFDHKKEDQYFDVIHAPYVKDFSEKLQRDLNRMQVGFVMKRGKILNSELCKLKQQSPPDEKKNVMYEISCKTCGKKYIGETSQRFAKRKYQHKLDVRNCVTTNGIYQHLKHNKEHQIDWEGAIFIDKDFLLFSFPSFLNVWKLLDRHALNL